jgi:hypothetical protein
MIEKKLYTCEICNTDYEDVESAERCEKSHDEELRMKAMLPKGYWYTYDIDINWNRPKKYSIKNIGRESITVKEVVKKKPWKGFTGEHTYSLKGFLCLKTYKTEKEALEDYKNNDYIHKLSRHITMLHMYFNEYYGHYNIKEYSIPKEKDSNGSVWFKLFGAEITNREWLKNYKDKLHPNDDWTNVNLETYARWIHLFDRNEAKKLIDDALEDHVVGYLD